MAYRVLVTEKIADEGLKAIRSKGYEVDTKYDLSPEELISVIEPYDAMIVRSNTFVNKELLEAAKNLKIIGRAGVTVDNIDLDAAAQNNVIVCNAPTSNIISAAEHTMALMLACARLVPQANASMHRGEWTRHSFTGIELYGKTLAIIGLGRVGSAVAERAKAFGMNLIAYDPYCSPERALEFDVTLYDSLDGILSEADIITVHLPRTSDTLGMFGPKEFASMKNGVILINSARGGIYDIESLADFVAAGKIAAAAIDVFEEEPCIDSPLHDLENVILTPHISAVTKEAQIAAGEQIAEYIWSGLEGSIVPTAINASNLPPEVLDEVRPYVPACKMMGKISLQMLGHMPKRIRLSLEGTLANCAYGPLIAGLLDGVISYKQTGGISTSSAMAMAKRHGIDIDIKNRENAEEYTSAISIIADDIEIACTLYGKEKRPRIISLQKYKIDIAPTVQSLIFEYVDNPGRIGTIGAILGESNINITTMQIGTKPETQCALVYLNIEGEFTQDVMDKLRNSIDLKNMWYITI